MTSVDLHAASVATRAPGEGRAQPQDPPSRARDPPAGRRAGRLVLPAVLCPSERPGIPGDPADARGRGPSENPAEDTRVASGDVRAARTTPRPPGRQGPRSLQTRPRPVIHRGFAGDPHSRPSDDEPEADPR